MKDIAAVDQKIEELLEAPVYVIDILPFQVPPVTNGQYFTVDDYWHQSGMSLDIGRRFLNVLLKANCYVSLDLRVREEHYTNPDPKLLETELMTIMKEQRGSINILIEDNALISIDGCDLYMSVYTEDNNILALLGILASSQGLFFRKAPEENTVSS